MLLESINVKLNRIFTIIPGPYWGLVSIIIGLLGDLFAYLLYQGYDLTYMVSDLGTGPGAIFFNMGTILSGIFALIFYLYLSPNLKFDGVNETLHRVAIILAIMSCIFFIFIGIFPSVSSNPILFILHGGTAMFSWICGIGYKTLFSYLMLKNGKFLKIHSYVGMMVVLVEVIFLFTWIPFIEWMMVLFITIWISLLTHHTFRKKELMTW